MPTVERLPLNSIIPGRNYRVEMGDVQGLAASIRERGLINPIRVRRLKHDVFEIVSGHRRYQACRLLGNREIDAIVIEGGDVESALERLVENLQREDLQPIEIARGVQSLRQHFAMDDDAIARALGMPTERVRTYRLLGRLPDDTLSKLNTRIGGATFTGGATPRHIQRILPDIPDPSSLQTADAREEYERKVNLVSDVVTSLASGELRLNAHQADEIWRRIGQGEEPPTVIQDVANRPQDFRYSQRRFDWSDIPEPEITSAGQLEEDAWLDYQRVQTSVRVALARLRPEIASNFSARHRNVLANDWEDIVQRAHNYLDALRGNKAPGEQLRELDAPKDLVP